MTYGSPTPSSHLLRGKALEGEHQHPRMAVDLQPLGVRLAFLAALTPARKEGESSARVQIIISNLAFQIDTGKDGEEELHSFAQQPALTCD